MPNDRNRTIGLVLIAIGLIVVLSRSFSLDLGDVGWPLFILIPGLLLLFGMVRGRAGANLAVPGCVVTTIGVILFLQNITGRFETWAYVWALIPAAAGLGQLIQSGMTEDRSLQKSGQRTLLFGLGMFAVFGIFFEFLIFGDWRPTFITRVVLPLALIAVGVYLLRTGRSSGGPE